MEDSDKDQMLRDDVKEIVAAFNKKVHTSEIECNVFSTIVLPNIINGTIQVIRSIDISELPISSTSDNTEEFIAVICSILRRIEHVRLLNPDKGLIEIVARNRSKSELRENGGKLTPIKSPLEIKKEKKKEIVSLFKKDTIKCSEDFELLALFVLHLFI